MSKNKRITAKEIKQGVTAWIVQVGRVFPITFTSKVYYVKASLVPGWRFKYVNGIGLNKNPEFLTQPWERFLTDAGITCPGSFRPAYRQDREVNCVFRTKKAAEKFLQDSQPALALHEEQMAAWDSMFDEDMYDEVFEDMREGVEP